MEDKEFDHCGCTVWNRLGRVKLIRNWPTNCGHTRYVLLRENILIDTCKHEHRQQQKVRREWRALSHTRTVGEKRQKNVSCLRDTHVVLSFSPGYALAYTGHVELLYVVLLFLMAISPFLCNWYVGSVRWKFGFNLFNNLRENKQLKTWIFVMNLWDLRD